MELITALSAIVSLIMLIVFFMMASNISKIHALLETQIKGGGDEYQVLFGKGEAKEFLGKKQEALDYYNEAYFMLTKKPNKGDKDLRNGKTIQDKITSLGGSLPT